MADRATAAAVSGTARACALRNGAERSTPLALPGRTASATHNALARPGPRAGRCTREIGGGEVA